MGTKRRLEEEEGEVPSYVQVLRWKDASGATKEMLFPKALDLDRPKRPRTTFSEAQLGVLEAEFAKAHYLVGAERSRLAQQLSLSETQIKVWFQNRRTKLKRGTGEGGEGGGTKGRTSDSEAEQGSENAAAQPPASQHDLLKLNPLLFPFRLPALPNQHSLHPHPWPQH